MFYKHTMLYPNTIRVLASGLVALFFSVHLTAQSDTLRLIFTGDIMGHAPQITSAEVVKDKKYNYEPCFEYVKPLLEGADLAIGNLEVTLPGKPPYQGYPMFRSPDDLATALKNAGFDILVTANNHSNDSRGPGVVNTLTTVRNLGFQQTGTFKNQRDREQFYPLMVYKNGFKIALLNYTYGTNGVPTDAPTIVNLIDTALIRRDLEEARARKPHYIIAFMHWGLEYQLQENPEQRAIAKFLIKHGADMIIGAHPHVVQPIKMETAPGPDGTNKEVLVAYSLGNFISNQQKPHTDGGIMFQVDLIKEKGSPEVQVGKYGYLPVYRYVHKPASGKSTYYALPIERTPSDAYVTKNMPTASKQAMQQWGDALKKRLNTSKVWK